MPNDEEYCPTKSTGGIEQLQIKKKNLDGKRIMPNYMDRTM